MMKKRTIYIIILVAAISASLVLISSIRMKTNVNSVLMSVNGSEISEDEFNMYLVFNKALIADYFKQIYDADYSEHFWTTSYAGVTPLQKLVDEAKAQLTRAKVEQRLAQQSGIVKEIGFRAFQNEMEAENSRRIKAAANNEIVYGPATFELQAFYNYYMSNLENKTIDAMRSNGLIVISEEQLKKNYETNKQLQFTLPGEISLEWATLPYGSGTAFKDKADALVIMNQLQKAVAEGESEIDTANGLGIDVFEAVITNASRRSAALESPLALQKATQLMVGESSDIFEENGALHIIRCLSIGDPINQSFELVKDSIAHQMALEKFSDIVKLDVKNAAIEWNGRNETKLTNKWIGMNSN